MTDTHHSHRRPPASPDPGDAKLLSGAPNPAQAQLPAPRGTTTAHPPFSSRRHRPGAMLHCPCCHLNLRQRHPQISVDYCPRCIARAHELVPLLPAPAAPGSISAARIPPAWARTPHRRPAEGRGRIRAAPAPPVVSG